MTCIFCKIVRGELDAARVFEDEHTLGFLDNRPLFPGHVLLVPKVHVDTMLDLPPALIGPLFGNSQRVARAIEKALGAEGTFMAINNKVSQTVPHLHLHVIPRKKGDGLKGFFWPRVPYDHDEHMHRVAQAIREAIV